MKHTKPRFRMKARLAAIKRRNQSVEITAGFSSESNGFFLFRKRNPIEQRELRRAMTQPQNENSEETATTTMTVTKDPRNLS